jgi:uncharacterized protein
LTEPSNGAPAGRRTLLSLVAIGLVAGVFSALFGVGGGIIIVPLLILLLRYDAKIATATSLAAVIFMAASGAATHGALGNVQWDTALLVGIPAMLGVTLGVSVKRRLSSAALTYAFAAVLVLVAVGLVVE